MDPTSHPLNTPESGMTEVMFLSDLLMIFAVSIIVVFLFQKLRLPSVAGFLVAGTLVGPHGLNLISDREQVEVLAEIGVMLLLFTIGIEFSLTHLKASRRIFFIAGPLQVSGVLLLVTAGGVAAGLPFPQALFWGMLLSLSSTAIVLKALADRGESDTLHGRSTIGVLIFQDLAVVAMMLLTPLLVQEKSDGASQLLIALAVSVALVTMIVIAARVIVPRLLDHIVHTRNRELFLLTVIVLCLGTAWLTSLSGMSLALGAFIAGLLISESEYSHQALAEVLPFRDSFNSLFFVSIGMLMDPLIVIKHPWITLLLIAAILAGKFLTATGAVLATGAPLRSSLLAGIALSQVGEFSFILAQTGQQVNLLREEPYQMFLAVSVLTMVITPFLIQWSPLLARRIEAFQRLHKWFPTRTTPPPERPRLKIRDHVVIVGYGLNGRNLARVLQDIEIPYVVLELRNDLVRQGIEDGGTIVYGDASNPSVLRHVHIDSARVMVIAISDPFATRRVVQMARTLNEKLHIVVRTRYLKELNELMQLGVDEVVPEEFETSIEIFTMVLRTYKIPQQVILDKAEQIRREGYAFLRRGDLPELAHHLRTGTLADVEVETCKIDDQSPAMGKTLGQLSVHARTGASVIALTRAGITTPNPDEKTRLASGDVIVLLGIRDQLLRAVSLLTDGTPS